MDETEFLHHCPLCGAGEGLVPFLTCPDHLLGSGQYSMVQCGSCGLVFTNPRPREEELPAFYQSEQYVSHTEHQNSLRERIYFRVQSYMLKRKFLLISKLKGRGRLLLDVGCGAGAFGNYMQDHGYQAIGIEPQPAAREKTREKGIQVFDSQEEMLKDAKDSFDFITLWHVMEHQSRFMESFEQYHQLLKDNGWLIIAVPQYQSYDAGHYNSWWAAYDLPRHLNHFSPKTLEQAASQKGFRLVKKKGMPFDAFYVSILSEYYKGNALAFIRGALVGLWSNLLALIHVKPWSSQIFIFQKR
ncbi:MAG: class I SAM-dependent methyltransferase [Bacteroides sp.]|jgi:2-polyprenyl-3-methyl-5-hydroxy-6-metoxy-1,4-benzoquinol methylase|nr:class I SAM-dependent methyltransferase [Bacteroides sp.]